MNSFMNTIITVITSVLMQPIMIDEVQEHPK